ncbi:alpha/beta fold hydrolase [Planococcus sp. APC 4015]|nr:alpha/beta fold hydrolase [Planococcus sp. APC 4015]
MTDTTRFSSNADHDFVIRTVIGAAVEGAADPGEVLAATASVRSHDEWLAAWRHLAERTAQIAADAASRGHRVSAAYAALRASTYFGVAVNATAADADTADLRGLFSQQRAAWEQFVAGAPARVEHVDIPYALSSMPGYFFRPAASDGGSGQTLVTVNGSDGSLASLWASCIAAALRRGYNVLVFDGPGQLSQLYERNVTFRPDWENVLTPVYDFVSRMQGVDPTRIALYGISQGGYWVARALAFEHRFAAAVTDPGIVDVSASWTSHVPKSLLTMLDDGHRDAFDRDMALGMKVSPGAAQTWRFRARPYGTTGYADTVTAVRTYDLRDVASRITTPLMITSPDHEQFWPGQSEALAALTASVSTVVRFTAEEGADGHCEPMARGLAAQRIFDWVDDRLARAS